MQRRHFLKALGTAPVQVQALGGFPLSLKALLSTTQKEYQLAVSQFIVGASRKKNIKAALAQASMNFRLQLSDEKYNTASEALGLLKAGQYDFLITNSELWQSVSAESIYFSQYLKSLEQAEVEKIIFELEEYAVTKAVYDSLGLISIPVAYTDIYQVYLSRLSLEQIQEKLTLQNSICLASASPFTQYENSCIQKRSLTWDDYKTRSTFDQFDFFDKMSVSQALHSPLIENPKSILYIDENTTSRNYIEIVTTKDFWDGLSAADKLHLKCAAKAARPSIENFSAEHDLKRIKTAEAKGLTVATLPVEISQALRGKIG